MIKKRIFLSILKEIKRNIDDWNEEEYNKFTENGELVFKKFLPEDDWNVLVGHTITITVKQDRE